MTVKVTMANNGSDSVDFINASSVTLAQVKSTDNGSSNGSLALHTTAAGTSTERVRIDSSGNVGIGTSSPTGPLQISRASGVPWIDVTGGSYTTRLFTNSASTGLSGLFAVTSNPLAFGVNNTESMRIDSSGNLLVGTTTVDQGSKLTVSGSNGISSLVSSAQGACFQGTYSNTGTGYYGYWKYGSTVTGSITSTGTTTAYNTTSDYRLKENIVPLTGALDKIAQLKPSLYNYKVDPTTSVEGFIAHELQAVVPHAVTGEKDAVDADGNPVYQGVDASFLIPHLVAAIQEQQTIITDLKARIEALEAK